MENFYDLLKINKNATQKEIKIAFIKLVSKYHPDVYNGDKSYAEKITAQLTEAYSILKDPDKRRDYDILLQVENQKYTTYTQDGWEIKRTYSGENYDQKVAQKYFKNSERKREKGNFFKRLFKSKLFYCILFIFTIEMLILIFIYLK